MRHDDTRPRAGKSPAGTFAAVIKAFLASDKFVKFAPATRDAWGRLLQIAGQDDTLGLIPVDVIRPSLVQAFLDGYADRPATQKNARAALKSLEGWAVVRDHLRFPITTGTEAPGSNDGHVPWTDAQVELGERAASPLLSRFITLAANTGQRGSDMVKMRWTDISEIDGRRGVNVVQQKTKRVVWVPMTNALEAAIETWDRNALFFVVTATGRRWTRRHLSTAWGEERAANPALAPLAEAGLVMHGLRATAVVRLRRAGASIPQIADCVGMSEAMVARYCRHSDQQQNALAAMRHLDRTDSEQSNVTPFRRGVVRS